MKRYQQNLIVIDDEPFAEMAPHPEGMWVRYTDATRRQGYANALQAIRAQGETIRELCDILGCVEPEAIECETCDGRGNVGDDWCPTCGGASYGFEDCGGKCVVCPARAVRGVRAAEGRGQIG